MEVSIVSSFSNNIEIMNHGISKGNAVKILAAYYGIKKEEIICFGDAENDISMLEYAGLGIAMGNAEAYVKEKADYVTDTNDNDGVAKAIEKYIFNMQ
jgi:Cof subfamily protein (haloacid dehalogenase superfamily)